MHANQATAGSGIWLVLSVTGILAYSDSLFGALRRAYELSARTTSFWEAPSAIQKVGSHLSLQVCDWPVWTLAFGHHQDRTPTHGYAETREAAMAAFAKSWRRPA